MLVAIPLSINPRDWGRTKSFTCSFSVDNSRFSKTCSSLKVGLRGFSILRAGVPGTFMALLSGDLGVMGTCADSRLESSLM